MTKSSRPKRPTAARTAAEVTVDKLPLGISAAAPMLKFAQDMRRWADNVLGVAGSASDLSLNTLRASPKHTSECS